MSSTINAYYSKLQEESFLAALREKIGTARIDLDKHPQLQEKMEQYKQFCERQRERQRKKAKRDKKKQEKKEKRRLKKEAKKSNKQKKDKKKKKDEKKKRRRLDTESESESGDEEQAWQRERGGGRRNGDRDRDRGGADRGNERKRKRERRHETSHREEDDGGREDGTSSPTKRKKQEEENEVTRSEPQDRMKKIEREMMEMELRKAALSALMEALKHSSTKNAEQQSSVDAANDTTGKHDRTARARDRSEAPTRESRERIIRTADEPSDARTRRQHSSAHENKHDDHDRTTRSVERGEGHGPRREAAVKDEIEQEPGTSDDEAKAKLERELRLRALLMMRAKVEKDKH
jgi:hypothetical protein